MFFESVYASWKPVQLEKYGQMSKQLDLKKLFHKKHVLDIAAGQCWFEEFLVKHGIDVSNFIAVDKSLKHLLDRSVKVPAVCLDAKNLGRRGAKGIVLLNEKFDAIIAIDCLHLIDFDFKKYLKPNGFVLASLFFSSGMEEKMKLLKQKLKGLSIEKEIVIKAKESEICVMAKL